MGTSEQFNIEEIMESIRTQVLARKADPAAENGLDLIVEGTRLPSEFYEHLYQAGLVYNQIAADVCVRKTNVLLLGPALQFARQKVHELVIYYVNQFAANQIRLNSRLLQAVNILGQELENSARD
jgi:hypothetical protein